MKLSKLTDYAVVLLSVLATTQKGPQSAANLATDTGIPAPTVAKLMKLLGRNGIVSSTRGTSGGYALSGKPEGISIADIIGAVEGPIALTACVEESEDLCAVESTCGVAGNWESVNAAVRLALQSVSLNEMAPDWRKMFKDKANG
ncbi:MAG: SUF system Fe-S cluster assembly regulator [Alphaproteobacteria bacterium]